VLFELSWTLRAAYKVSREEVQEILSVLAAECDGVATFNRKDFARMKIGLADI
jgi:predicted nucleic-acid-binding protein